MADPANRGASSSSLPTQQNSAPAGATRRGVIAALIGVVAGLFPFVVGLLNFANPLRTRKGPGANDKPGRSVRIGALAALPDDGQPRQFPVIADRQDAWTRHPNEAIGAVYLRRLKGSENVEAFNATCPHAGCFVVFNRARDLYHCPCHNSVWSVAGQLTSGPSPRDLDKLDAEVRRIDDQKDIWVRYVDYFAGIQEKIPKS